MDPFSVVIPTWNEAGYVGRAVQSARRAGASEVLVVDGGSDDDTLAEAADADVKFRAPRGRARQLNAGALRAQGPNLLFLHADCELEAGALAEAGELLARPGVVAGCFRQLVLCRGLLFRCIDGFATGRVRLTSVPYGDQGLFLRRERFLALGGFPEVGFMEDLLFGLRLRRAGRVVVARGRILVSPRRWRRAGVLEQTVCNWGLTALALAGVPPGRLERFYPAVR